MNSHFKKITFLGGNFLEVPHSQHFSKEQIILAEATSLNSLSDLLDHFVEVTAGQENVTIGDLIDSLSSRSHGPMLLFPAIIAVSPIGMIPGMSVVTGTLIILMGTQMMFSSSQPWVPKILAKFEFSREKFRTGLMKAKHWTSRIEKLVYCRMVFLTKGVAIYPIATACILLAISFYPLSVVPFGVFLPGCAVVMFGLGLTACDGLLILAGFGLGIGVSITVLYIWPF